MAPLAKTIMILTENYSHDAYGGGQAVRALVYWLSEQGIRCIVLASYTDENEASGNLCIVKLPVSRIGRPWCWGSHLKAVIREAIERYEPDVLHVHGVWMASQLFGYKAAIAFNIPVVFSLHGMLQPWQWNAKGIIANVKKRLYWKYLTRPMLNGCNAIHTITHIETDCVKKLITHKRFFEIPNAVEVDEQLNIENDQKVIHKTILFLGRVHPVKGIDRLIKAFSECDLDSSWCLTIAGPFVDLEYQSCLQSLVLQLGLGERVQFIGSVHGQVKNELIRSSWVAVVPSHTEVIGLVNLECATLQTPTITTWQTGLRNWEEGGGLLVKEDGPRLPALLQEACSWSHEERIMRGVMSRKFILNHYSWTIIGEQWKTAYASVIEASKGGVLDA